MLKKNGFGKMLDFRPRFAIMDREGDKMADLDPDKVFAMLEHFTRQDALDKNGNLRIGEPMAALRAFINMRLRLQANGTDIKKLFVRETERIIFRDVEKTVFRDRIMMLPEKEEELRRLKAENADLKKKTTIPEVPKNIKEAIAQRDTAVRALHDMTVERNSLLPDGTQKPCQCLHCLSGKAVKPSIKRSHTTSKPRSPHSGLPGGDGWRTLTLQSGNQILVGSAVNFFGCSTARWRVVSPTGNVDQFSARHYILDTEALNRIRGTVPLRDLQRIEEGINTFHPNQEGAKKFARDELRKLLKEFRTKVKLLPKIDVSNHRLQAGVCLDGLVYTEIIIEAKTLSQAIAIAEGKEDHHHWQGKHIRFFEGLTKKYPPDTNKGFSKPRRASIMSAMNQRFNWNITDQAVSSKLTMQREHPKRWAELLKEDDETFLPLC